MMLSDQLHDVTGRTPGPSGESAREAFDAAAPVYDSVYESLPGIVYARRIVTQVLTKYFHPGDSLLELNCGTGTDALTLASQGMRILATDASPNMLEEVQRKVRKSGLQGSVQTLLMPFSRLSELSGNSFDGAYSNMGGLNCIGDLSPVASALAPLVRPGGHVVAVVMPPICIWEMASSLSRLNLTSAFRRFARGGRIAQVHGKWIKTYYHSPRTFLSSFGAYFEPVEWIGLNMLTPPPNFLRARTIAPRVINALERFDARLCRLPLLRSAGDHYIAVLRRIGGRA